MAGQPPNQPKYEVIACIAGRGFGVRREDMKKLLLATRGKVFTSQNLDQLIEFTRLKEFQTKQVWGGGFVRKWKSYRVIYEKVGPVKYEIRPTLIKFYFLIRGAH